MYPMEDENYEEMREKRLELLRKTEKKAKTSVAKRALKSAEREDSPACSLARMVFRESLDAYEDGTMEWEEMVEDLYKTLKAIEVKNSKEDY